MPTLVIQLPNMPPVEHVLREDAVTIGRMKGNTIALDDISVSLSHAKLTRRDGDYYLKDLNSTNGTMLNGQSVSEARLHNGDHVKFGEVAGRFYTDVAPAMPPNAPVVAPVRAPVAPVQALTASTAAAASAARFQPRRHSSPKAPVLVGAVVLVVAGVLAWKFFFSEQDSSRTVEQPLALAGAAPENSTAKAVNPTTVSRVPSTPVSSLATARPMSRDVPTPVRGLESNDVVERRQAAATLNSMGSSVKEAVPALRGAIKDSDPEVRMWAALSLINNGVYDKATVPILTQLLRHESPVLRQVACLSLALIPYDEPEKDAVISALTELANKEENEEVRSAAISAMKMIVSPPAPGH